MFKGWRKASCDAFGHDMVFSSPSSTTTRIGCKRCGKTTDYDFKVEKTFWEENFPETYGDNEEGNE